MATNILIIGAFGPGAMENYYLQGFRKTNAIVTTYDIATEYYSVISGNPLNKIINRISPAHLLKSLNNKLLQYLNKKYFDVILVFKGMQLFPDTVQALKLHSQLLANYNPDHPFKFYSPGSGNNNVLNSIPHYNIYFSYSTQITRQLNEKFNVLAHTIPFGYDDTKEISRGSMPDVKDKILFIGSYDKNRARFLNKMVNTNLLIFGDLKWHTRNILYPTVRKAYQQIALYDNAYKISIAEAAGVINLMREQNMAEQSHNMRTFEVPGNGGVLISQRTEEQLSFFEEDMEAIYFDSTEELKSKIDFLEKNPETIKHIKSAAYKRCIKSGYSYNERSFQLLKKIKIHL